MPRLTYEVRFRFGGPGACQRGQRNAAVGDDDQAVALEGDDGIAVGRLLACRDRPQRVRRAAGGTSLRSATACAAARSATRATGTRRRAGRRSQRGMRARQIVAPRSKSAWAQPPSNASPVRSCTRRTFVSTGSTSRPNAKLPTAAAVYGPTPGSSVRSSGQPPLGDDARCRVKRHRAPVVAEPLPLEDDLGGGGGRQGLDGRPALEPRRASAARHGRPASAAASPR